MVKTQQLNMNNINSVLPGHTIRTRHDKDTTT